MRLFKGDAYVIIEGAATIDLSGINESNGRRLCIDFEIRQTVDSSPNDGRVSIYNLSEDTRKQLEEKDLIISVFAGYDDEIKLIGTGDVKNIVNLKQGTDWKTDIIIGDGKKSYDESKHTSSHIEGTPSKGIIDEVAASFGLPIKDITTKPFGEILGGKTIQGKSKDIMESLSQEYDFDWSIQDGELLLTNPNEPDDLPAILVNARTGLQQNPQYTERGVDVLSQLNPDIRPKRIIEVESIVESSSGIFIAEEVTFSGNNYGGAFDVKISARTL